MDAVLSAGWALLWVGGGWLLAASLFRLRRGETAMVGIGLGLVIQVWCANALAHVVAAPTAFWLSSALVALFGIVATLRFRSQDKLRFSLGPWVTLIGLTALFVAIGRGLAIFDDYQNLPTVSLMAAGDVPPHFALNPTLRFGYHYALLLFAAEVMRLGGLFPWSALDVARGFSLALPLLLAGLWGYRLTHSRPAALLTGCLVAFAGGARWLLLLLPPSWMDRISANVTLIGSSASSASNLAEAMVSSWKIDGAGPLPFPFAFYSGVNQPYVMAYTGIAGIGHSHCAPDAADGGALATLECRNRPGHFARLPGHCERDLVSPDRAGICDCCGRVDRAASRSREAETGKRRGCSSWGGPSSRRSCRAAC